MEFLSGNIPGGIYLCLFILLTVHITLRYFYKSSKLISKKSYRKKAIWFTFFIVFVYSMLWLITQPPHLPQSVIFIPFENQDSTDYVISEIMEDLTEDAFTNDYRLHHWIWLYNTADEDSVHLNQYRITIASRMQINNIIYGTLNGQTAEVHLVTQSEYENKQFNYRSKTKLAKKVLSWLDEKINLLRKKTDSESQITDEQYNAVAQLKIKLAQKKNENILQDMDYFGFDSLLQAQILIAKGISEPEENNQNMLEEKKLNRYFAKAQNILIRYARRGMDNYKSNFLLGKMFLFDGQFDNAEIFFKKSYSQNKFYAPVYYNLSFIHPSRYQDIGFKNRFEILEKALDYNPGYIEAAQELADEYFSSGTGTATGYGSTKAIMTLENALRIHPGNRELLSIVARIYVQTKHTQKAIDIYKTLLKDDPDSADLMYNIGTALFNFKDYEQAKKYFNKAIETADHPDSYLYLGTINRIQGDNQKALYYYRERVKRMSGDDDKYAREAMKGIRIILADIAEQDSLNNLKKQE